MKRALGAIALMLLTQTVGAQFTTIGTGPDVRTAGRVGVGTSSGTPAAHLEIFDIFTAGGKNLLIGNDTFFTDVDQPNTLGLFGNQNSAFAHLRLSGDLHFLTAPNGATTHAGSVPDEAQVHQRMSAMPVPFEANLGQEDQRVAFMARTLGATLFVTRAGELVYSFPGRVVGKEGDRKVNHERGAGWVLTESLVDAHPVVRGEAPSTARVSRFIGCDANDWQSSVPTFERVVLGEVWPGIALALSARGNNVEKIFTVSPGADAERIAIRLSGAMRLELATDGALIAHTGNGPVSFTAPRAWQDIKGERRPVRAAYTLAGSRYGFHLRDYDPAYSVIIDPLLQATYLGGSGPDQVNAIALDANGDVFVAGSTDSPSFPGTAGGAQPNFVPSTDAFVAKLTNSLTALTQSTYLGGLGFNQAFAIALDTNGNVFVAGSTSSPNFPGTAGGAQSTYGSGSDAFVAKLSNDLKSLITPTTYLGGNGLDGASAIALDANGDVFVAGGTTGNFPGTTGGAQPTYGGSPPFSSFGDAFVAKLTNNLTTRLQATYLGGSGDEYLTGIALHPSGVFVTGYTSGSFPVTAGGAQLTYGGGAGLGDTFVAKLKYNLTAPLIQATYLGGSGQDTAHAIVVDASGNVFVAGRTASVNFPATAGGTQTTTGGSNDAFVARLNNGLTASPPIKATYLGGIKADSANAIALDTAGNVFVAGATGSSNFPGTAGGAQAAYAGDSGATGFVGDAFVARLINDLSSLTQATFLGGSGDERANGVVLNPSNNNVFVAGWTDSPNFPGIAGGAQQTYDTNFVAKLTRGLHDVANSTANNDGDPHITTTNGIHYNFQSAGEFTALRDGAGMVIQTRQSPTSTFGPFFDSYTGLTTCVSLNTALAARVGKNRVTYQPNFSNAADPRGLQLRVDGVLTPLSPAGLNLSGGGRVVRTGGALEIDFPDGTVLIATPYWAPPQWFLNIGVFRTEASEGIMGAIPQGSWLPALPDGTSVGPMPATLGQRYATLNQTFANAWRVSKETSLFDYAPGMSTAMFAFACWPVESGSCFVPNSPPPAKPMDPDRAREICRAIVDKTRNADCVFDVAATGVPAFADAYLLTERIQEGATTTTVFVDRDPSNQGEAVTFTATVTRTARIGNRGPTGTVQFVLDGNKAGNVVNLDANGRAVWKTSSLQAGNHKVAAGYIPGRGSLFLASRSLDKPHTVRAVVVLSNLSMQAGDENTPCPTVGVALSRADAATVPYLRSVLPALDQQCSLKDAGRTAATVTFLRCAKDPRGTGFGPNASANVSCAK